jgi:ABC-2 type transport system ATP-binding protein
VTAVIETEQLTKTYGAHRGIVDVDLSVNEGEAFGFLGPNGAGKTTTIRTLLDHIRPTSGRATIFGIVTTEDPVAIHRRLDVDPSRKFREYSKGNKQKIGLVIALQHRPDLLLLDEPTSGLDPLIQQEFYAVIRDAKAEGRTVFLSSHILSEVEKTCDRVAIIRDGRLARVDRTEALRDLAHHQVELIFTNEVPLEEFSALPGVSDVVAEDHTLHLRVFGSITPVVRAAALHELVDFVSREPSLEETFLAEYGKGSVEAATR